MNRKEEAKAALAELKRVLRRDAKALDQIRSVSGYITELRRRVAKDGRLVEREAERCEVVLKRLASCQDDLSEMKRERDEARNALRKSKQEIARLEQEKETLEQDLRGYQEKPDDYRSKLERVSEWAASQSLSKKQAFGKGLLGCVQKVMPKAPTPEYTSSHYYVFDFYSLYSKSTGGNHMEEIGALVSLLAFSGFSIAINSVTNVWLGDEGPVEGHPELEKFRKWAAPLLKRISDVQSTNAIEKAVRPKTTKPIRRGPLSSIV